MFKNNQIVTTTGMGAGVLLIDQVSKWLAQEAGFVQLNRGFSFGWLAVDSIIFYTFAYLLTCLVIWWVTYEHQQKLRLWLVMIFSGGLSNLIDRWVYGGVRDFLSVPFLQLENNLADWAIAIGVVIIGYVLLKLHSEKADVTVIDS